MCSGLSSGSSSHADAIADRLIEMTGRRMDSEELGCLLHVSQAVLGELSVRRMGQAEADRGQTDGLVAAYGHLRQLRDYLQRCLATGPEDLELDLEDGDLAMLGACCARVAAQVDLRAVHVDGAQERQDLRDQASALADLAVEVTRGCVADLPLEPLDRTTSPTIRVMHSRIEAKSGGRSPAPATVPVQTGASAWDPLGVGEQPSLHDAEGDWATGSSQRAPRILASDTVLRDGCSPASVALAETDFRPSAAVSTPCAAVGEAVATPESVACGRSDPAASAAAGFALRTDGMRCAQQARMLREEHDAWVRALQAGVARHAARHLAGMLETALVDFAVPRVELLGLSKSAESWTGPELLVCIMGEALRDEDRRLAERLFAAAGGSDPIASMASAAVPSPDDLDRWRLFTARVLRSLRVAVD